MTRIRLDVAAALVALSAWSVAGGAQTRTPPPPKPTPAPLVVASVPPGLVTVHATTEQMDGTLVTGLTRNDFRVVSDGQPRPIAFFSAADEPITVVLLLDVSVSFTTRFGTTLLVDSVELAFLPGFKPGDRLRLGTVTGRVSFVTPFTSDRRTLLEAVRAISTPTDTARYGPSPIWDGVDAAITILAPEPGRRAVVVITDGRSTGNVVSYKDVAAHAMRTGVMIHIIGKDTQEVVYRDTGPVRTSEPEVALRLLADNSGGSFRSDTRLRGVVPDRSAVAGLQRLLARMTTSLHQMYTLAFAPSVEDVHAHTIDVQSTVPGVIVHARQGYFSGPGAPTPAAK